MSKRTKIIAALVLLVVIAAVVITQFSLRGQLEDRIEQLMKDQGIEKPEVTIKGYNTQHMHFSSVKFTYGKQNYLFKDVDIVATSLPYRELLQRNYANVAARWSVKEASIQGIDYKLPVLLGEGVLQMKDNKPVVTGELHDAGNTHSGNFTVTSKIALLENLRAQQENMKIQINEISFPYGKEKPILVDHVAINQGKLRIELRELDMMRKENKQGEGFAADWEMNKIIVSGMDYDVPNFTGTGEVYTDNDTMFVSGLVRSIKRDYSGSFLFGNQMLTITNAQLPWEGAVIHSSKIVVPLGQDKPVTIPLSIAKLPLDTLLNKIMKEKASGTGFVSGSATLTIFPNKTFTISDGNLAADQEGVIKIAPEALPGEKAQMEITREVLSDFHYKLLSIKTSKTANDQVAIQLSIEGNNPKAYDGRIVKLNINLTGDVIDLLNQTILPLADPLQYLQKEKS